MARHVIASTSSAVVTPIEASGCKLGNAYVYSVGKVGIVTMTQCLWDGSTLDGLNRPQYLVLPEGLKNVDSVWSSSQLQDVQSPTNCYMPVLTSDARLVFNTSGETSREYLRTTGIYASVVYLMK